MVPNTCEVIDCFHQNLHSGLESVGRTLWGPWGRGDSDSPATASIVLKDTCPGTKPQVLPFVLWKTPDKFSFWKCLFSLISSNKSLSPKYLSLPIKSPRWKTHCCWQRKASSWLVICWTDVRNISEALTAATVRSLVANVTNGIVPGADRGSKSILPERRKKSNPNKMGINQIKTEQNKKRVKGFCIHQTSPPLSCVSGDGADGPWLAIGTAYGKDKMDSGDACPCNLVWICKQLPSVVQCSEITVVVGDIAAMA